MGIKDWFVSVTSQRSPRPAGLYRAVNAAGETRYYGISCPKCGVHSQSTPGQFGGAFRYWCCGREHCFTFPELRSSVKKSVRIGTPGNLLPLDSTAAESGLKSGWAIFRQSRR